jgi:hypothetical protein
MARLNIHYLQNPVQGTAIPGRRFGEMNGMPLLPGSRRLGAGSSEAAEDRLEKFRAGPTSLSGADLERAKAEQEIARRTRPTRPEKCLGLKADGREHAAIARSRGTCALKRRDEAGPALALQRGWLCDLVLPTTVGSGGAGVSPRVFGPPIEFYRRPDSRAGDPLAPAPKVIGSDGVKHAPVRTNEPTYADVFARSTAGSQLGRSGIPEVPSLESLTPRIWWSWTTLRSKPSWEPAM